MMFTGGVALLFSLALIYDTASSVTLAQSDINDTARSVTLAQSDINDTASSATLAQSDINDTASSATLAQSDINDTASSVTLAQSDNTTEPNSTAQAANGDVTPTLVLCEYNGEIFYPDYDYVIGCSVYRCAENGTLEITARPCDVDTSGNSTSSCEYEGKPYQVGSIPQDKPCYACECTASGEVSCVATNYTDEDCGDDEDA